MSTARGEETRRRLLDAALALHAEQGDAGFTVHAVVASSGVSLGSLYHHFESFEGLAAALYVRCLTGLLEHLVRELGAARTAKSGIPRVVRAYLEFSRDRPTEARFIHASSHATFHATQAAAIGPVIARAREPLAVFARRQIARGGIVDLPEPLIEALWIGIPAELTRRWLAGEPGLDLDHAIATVPSRVLAAMVPPRGRSSRGDAD